jgi:hypothetical protein
MKVAVILFVFIANVGPTAYAQKFWGLTPSCTPDGTVEHIKMKLNERKYWVAKHVEIGMYLADDALDDPCRYLALQEKSECIATRQNYLRAAYACFIHTARMCNSFGGRCSTNLNDFR